MNATPELLEPTRGSIDGFAEMLPAGGLPAAMAPVGHTAVNTYGDIITAQRVAIPRNLTAIMQNLKVMANMRGDAYVYSWPVNDRKNRKKSTIEGPTVKLANDLARIYGNCLVKTHVDETATHWIIYARFVDLETGFGYERPFQQRKSQDTGMKDSDRAADLIFQIGVSKAIRNVVVNALSTFSEYMVDEAKNGLLKRFEDDANKEKTHQFIDRVMEEHGIAELQVTAVVGRQRDKWTIRDLVRVYTEMRGIKEGLSVASEIYPSLEDARVVTKEKEDKDTEGRKPVAKDATTDKPPKDANPDKAQPAAQQQAEKPDDEKRAAEDKALEIPANLRRTGNTAKPKDDPPPQAAAKPAEREPTGQADDGSASLFGDS